MLNIGLVPASVHQQPILANLLELYIHDFSEFLLLEPGPDGRFGFPDLPLYWTTPGRHPFLITVNGNWAGFVLVKTEPAVTNSQPTYDPTYDLTYDIDQFFIVRTHRRRGIGFHVAHEVWRRFPGPWTVRVMQLNHAALPFWERAIAAFTGDAVNPTIIQRNGHSLLLYSFISPPPRTR